MGQPKDGKFRRKLEPGEVVEVPEDMLNDEGENLMDMLWDTGTIDIVPDSVAVTRPLDYENRREALLCSPTFKSRGADDDRLRDKVLAKVDKQLLEQSDSLPDEVESPEDDKPEPEPPPKAAKPKASRKKTTQRVRRGARPKAHEHGAAISP